MPAIPSVVQMKFEEHFRSREVIAFSKSRLCQFRNIMLLLLLRY
jgi:hypothetical protein